MSDKPTTLRDDIRAILRADWGGRSTNSIALELGQPRERIRHALKNLKERGELVRGDDSQWYWRRSNGIVPERVGVIRRLDPDVAGIEEQVLQAQEEDEPQEIVELAEHLDRVSVVPAAELDKPAPAVDWETRDVQPDVEIRVTVPTWVARKVFDVLEAASREAKAAGRWL